MNAAHRLDGDSIVDILWSARRAGRLLIVPRTSCTAALAQLNDEGLVREQLGHIVLTPKGEQRRRAAQHPALRAAG